MPSWYDEVSADDHNETKAEENNENEQVDPDYDDKPESIDPAGDTTASETASDNVEDDPQVGDPDGDPEDEQEPDDLVEMDRMGHKLRVHPTCVAAHEKVGWKVVN